MKSQECLVSHHLNQMDLIMKINARDPKITIKNRRKMNMTTGTATVGDVNDCWIQL